MGNMKAAIKHLNILHKYGKVYKSNLMDDDCKKVYEHKKFLFINRRVEHLEISTALADQIINRRTVWKINRDVKDYYEKFKGNKKRISRGFYSKIDSEKDYNISGVKLLTDLSRKIESVYLNKKDNKEFDRTVSHFAKFLETKVVYKQEVQGLDISTSMTVNKLTEQEKQTYTNIKEVIDSILHNEKQIQINNAQKDHNVVIIQEA
jgi:hypothetical protein